MDDIRLHGALVLDDVKREGTVNAPMARCQMWASNTLRHGHVQAYWAGAYKLPAINVVRMLRGADQRHGATAPAPAAAAMFLQQVGLLPCISEQS